MDRARTVVRSVLAMALLGGVASWKERQWRKKEIENTQLAHYLNWEERFKEELGNTAFKQWKEAGMFDDVEPPPTVEEVSERRAKSRGVMLRGGLLNQRALECGALPSSTRDGSGEGVE
eukprot:GHVN01007242.1.p1 GENE.GHVN01007242.1~~GHVN01007242.1.p1  ORF type:complete len:119 (+),score=37.33 GHVN01007242.1:109-465(+)